ncbi:DUF4440 domain-containing protein [Aurantiacibacter aquimixticola]|uniref:Nuclear transport factor 2 family protein n=1 Tax=Aurantiacibacter aquimixticola TaxID=1958945 RepID=A0A419RRZ0_9SPHN|nr:DUF4440 domain-containing protein [Aurantiacibacter aquimixticola]RJY08536.1 nuclear transport factor 2 family protein [Aurantiacibacter aquimixticola]
MAITDEALWEMEERLWTAPVDDCAAIIAEDALLVFPEAGVLDRDFAVAGMRSAPRWDAVEMTERHVSRPGKTNTVLAYRARGVRGADEPYQAYCSSTWRGADEGWTLIQHQQTKAN